MMTGTIPGQEPAEFGGVIAAGLVFVFLFFWLCAKVGIQPTVGFFTTGLWPRWARRRRQKGQSGETASKHSDKTPPEA